MELLPSYGITEDNDGLTLTLYINSSGVEFSKELNSRNNKQNETFYSFIQDFVKEKFRHLKFKKVNVMAGSLLVASLIFNDSSVAAATNFNMGYVYFGGTDSFINFVDRTEGVINVTSPSYFDINLDGSLKLSNIDSRFISEMHKRGKKVVPFLSNHWDRELGRTALQNREILAQQIADAIEKHNLDGVNVDIENVTHLDRESYTDLVRLLREKIPNHKEVSVAVAANPNNWTSGWHGSYDYQQLAQYSDYLMIMAYDESYTGGPAGPVASVSFVERSIQYALQKGVPAQKVVIGLPHYGRYWIEGQSYGGYGLSNSRITDLFTKYEHTITFDKTSMSPKATLVIREGDPSTFISGTKLKPGTYTIWYENEQSIKAKVDLVEKYGVKGTGSWSLGQEDPTLWHSFKTWVTQPVKLTGISVDRVSPQLEQTPIALEANASGGTDKLYRFWIRENGEWRVLQEYSPSNKLNWTPSKAGDYRISIHTKDKSSVKAYDDYKYIDYTIKPLEVKLSNISLDKQSPQLVNSKINITATGQGNTDQLYRFYVRENGEWKLLQDYSPLNSVDWLPSNPGDYRISVHVKGKNSVNSYDDYKYLDYKIESNKVKMIEVSTDNTTSMNTGSSINLIANATGGTEKQYRFWLRENGEWKIIQDYSSLSTITWVPQKPGDYRISVHVKDKFSTKEFDDYSFSDFTIKGDPVKVSSVTTDQASPQTTNKRINISINATGGTERLYRFWIRENGNWRILQDYSPNSTSPWSPSSPGNYRISVHAKDKNSTKEYDDYKFIDYEIKENPYSP